MLDVSSSRNRWVAVALAGPALAGAILGLREGPRAVAVLGLGLPILIAAVTALTAPTLYVGGALVGVRLSVAEVAAATRHGLAALGMALVGLAPVSLFLAATAWPASSARICGLVFLTAALVVALHRLRAELGPGARTAAASTFFAGYVVVVLLIGAHLLCRLLIFAEGTVS